MQTPDPIETILARLMPPALSQNCQVEIDSMIDELAGASPENVVQISTGKWLLRSVIGGGIAAAIGALCAVFPLNPEPKPVRVAISPPRMEPSKLVLISGSDRIESMTDGGRTLVQRDGENFHVSIQGPENNTIFDGQLSKDEILDKVPENWRARIQVLCRTLDQAYDGEIQPSRQPRPRLDPAIGQKP